MQGLMQDFPLTLVHVFERAARLHTKSSVVTATATGVERMGYGAWAERTRRLGGMLDDLGIAEGGRVGTFAWNSGRHLELYFAAPCSGRVLHTINIRLFPDQLKFVVNHAEDEVVFVDRSLIGALWQHAGNFQSVRRFVVMDDGRGEIPDDDRIVDYESLLEAASPREFSIGDENRAAALCYSSATTGNPKGVLYSHRSMFLHSMATMLADTVAIAETDVVMPVVPMFHVNAWGFPHAAVFAGATLVFPGPDLSPTAIADLLEAEKVTLTGGVPTIWMGVLDEIEGRDLSSLKTVVCGGSAVPQALSEAYRQTLGRPILQAWGMTETSPIGAVCRIRSHLRGLSEEELAGVRSAQGVPSPGIEARIVSPDGEEQPWDGRAAGELQVRGPWVARAYYKEEDEPAVTKDGWLRTGDVATIDDDGYIRLVDRTKDLVKSGGEWISSVELENEIMAHPKVAEASVIGVSHRKWQERPLACVVVKPEEELSKQDLIEWLEPRVARWWLPDDVVFVDEIPKTSVGKFSKKDLRARFADHELPDE
ncbi:long-chain fatty acid--CoA ligase [soil metagenome]